MFKFFRERAGTRPPSDVPALSNEHPPAVSEEEFTRRRNIWLGLANSEPFTEPDSEERELWRDGKLVPWYITYHLDSGNHYGPQVDIACHTEEPAVDLWEVGRLYPRWDQTVALARLLDVRVRDLAHAEARPHHHPDRPTRGGSRRIPILSFEPSAVREVTTAGAQIDGSPD